MSESGQEEGRTRSDLRAWNQAQIDEMSGPDNLWYAGERLGRSPSRTEAIIHYLTNFGPESFFDRHHQDGDFVH